MATLLVSKGADPSRDSAGGLAGAARVGAELRAARERLGWLLPDVANSLRIRLSYLQAVEDGRVADLPGSAYAVGFVRAYATSLGLDAGEIARRFRAEAIEVNGRPELAFPAPVPERGVPAGAVILVGAVIAALAYGAWFRFSGERGPAPADAVPPVPARLAPLAAPAPPPSPQVASVMPDKPARPLAAAQPPAPAAVAPPAPSPASPPLAASDAPAPPSPSPAQPAPAPAAASLPAGTHLAVEAKADSWVQVRERQGRVLLSRVLRAGETWPVPDEPNLLLTTGNAGGTELLVDGQPAPSLGKPGAVRRDMPLGQVMPASPSGSPASTPRPGAQ